MVGLGSLFPQNNQGMEGVRREKQRQRFSSKSGSL